MTQPEEILAAYHSPEAQSEAAERALEIHARCLLHFLNKLPYSSVKKYYIMSSSMEKEIERYESAGIVFKGK